MIIVICILLIIIILILLILNFIKCNNEKFINDKKICIYTYKFGNNYINHDIKKIKKKYNNIDFYFITDDKQNISYLNDINLNKNNFNNFYIKIVNKIEGNNFIDSNRLTAKYYKFVYLDQILSKYDFILHLDFGRLGYLNKLSQVKIYEIINKYSCKSLILRQNPISKINKSSEPDILKEIKFQTLKLKNENIINTNKFIKKLNTNVLYNLKHPESCIFIRKMNDFKLNYIFKKIYKELLINSLKRDQFVFNYTIDKYKYDIKKIVFDSYFTNLI